MLEQKDLDRFWGRVAWEHPTERGCWLWTGSVWNQYGHGRMWLKGKDVLAHRLMWIVWHGEEPTPHVLHKCDVPLCVNPDHLFLGTQVDNMKDRSAKGRAKGQHPGERNTNAKLTEANVKDIRSKYATGARQKDLAAEYGVDQSLISYVVRGKIWRHV